MGKFPGAIEFEVASVLALHSISTPTNQNSDFVACFARVTIGSQPGLSGFLKLFW